MNGKDYYAILGLGRDAGAEEVKKAFRQMAMKFHPDRNPGDQEAEQRFKEAAEAYEVLGDAEKRRLYDIYGHAGLKGTDFHEYANVEDIFSAFGGVFADLFGFTRARAAWNRGADLRYELAFGFLEAVKGAAKEIEVPRPVGCGECGGTGADPKHPPETCRSCRGTGQTVHRQGFLTIASTCRACGGQGRIIRHKCRACRGRGEVEEIRRLSVRIPPGVEDGVRLRLRGEGQPGTHGAPPGDLYIDVRVAPHEYFRRDGNDLLLAYPVTFSQAALGATVEIPTLDGTRKLVIPPGIQTHTSLRLKGEGVDDGRSVGDLVVQVLVQTPEKLSAEARKLYKKLASLEETVRMPWARDEGRS